MDFMRWIRNIGKNHNALLESELNKVINQITENGKYALDGIVLGCPWNSQKADSGGCRDDHTKVIADFLKQDPSNTRVLALTARNFMSKDNTNCVEKFNGLNIEHWKILEKTLCHEKVKIILDHTSAMWSAPISYKYDDDMRYSHSITLTEKNNTLKEVSEFIKKNVLETDGPVYVQRYNQVDDNTPIGYNDTLNATVYEIKSYDRYNSYTSKCYSENVIAEDYLKLAGENYAMDSSPGGN
jgi:hypothetical protein